MTKVFDEGVFKGFYKGYFAYLIHFLGVSYNSLLWSSSHSFSSHLILSSIFECVFYPVDTVKTLMNNDLGNNYKGYLDCLS